MRYYIINGAEVKLFLLAQRDEEAENVILFFFLFLDERNDFREML